MRWKLIKLNFYTGWPHLSTLNLFVKSFSTHVMDVSKHLPNVWGAFEICWRFLCYWNISHSHSIVLVRQVWTFRTLLACIIVWMGGDRVVWTLEYEYDNIRHIQWEISSDESLLINKLNCDTILGHLMCKVAYLFGDLITFWFQPIRLHFSELSTQQPNFDWVSLGISNKWEYNSNITILC